MLHGGAFSAIVAFHRCWLDGDVIAQPSATDALIGHRMTPHVAPTYRAALR
jgi:hypothetical protein